MSEVDEAFLARRRTIACVSIACSLAIFGCKKRLEPGPDPHSYSDPSRGRATHVDMDLDVDFDSQTISGRVSLHLDRIPADGRLVLDAYELDEVRVTQGLPGPTARPVSCSFGKADPLLGSGLVVKGLAKDEEPIVTVHYKAKGKGALNWFDPAQTESGKPFVAVDGGTIITRRWIPCQDTPGVRFTYSARVRVPEGLTALMNAAAPEQAGQGGVYRFDMRQPIPSYLVALAVGDLRFRSLGPRTGIWAEPGMIDRAAREFEDVEKLLAAAEALLGPYRWERFDPLVMPPGYAWGGMEYPRLTFLSPTVVVGDKSEVPTVAHELAHAWSGNLVTNADWSHIWLNEGVTTYFEHRLTEDVFGADAAQWEAFYGQEQLETFVGRARPEETRLHRNLAGMNPDDGITEVPYYKGALFFRTLEAMVGRPRLDAFMKGYLAKHAFSTITTEDFVALLRSELLRDPPIKRFGDTSVPFAADAFLSRWIAGEGVPPHPEIQNDAVERARAAARAWAAGGAATNDVPVSDWTNREKVTFLCALKGTEIPPPRLTELKSALGVTDASSSRVRFEWFGVVITNDFELERDALREYLASTSRWLYVVPIYEKLGATEEGRRWALEVFREHADFYNPYVRSAIEKALAQPS